MRASVGVVVPLRSTTSVLHGQSNKHLSLAENDDHRISKAAESESGRQRSRRFCVAVQVLIAIYVVFMVVVVLTITLLPADWRL